MTTRLIETCFDMENMEENYMHIRSWIFDPSLISKEDITELQNWEPGKLIYLRRGAWGERGDTCL